MQYNSAQTQTLDVDGTVGQWNAPGAGVVPSRVVTSPHSGGACLQVTTDVSTFGNFRAWPSSPGYDLTVTGGSASSAKQVVTWLRSSSGTVHIDCLIVWVNASNVTISTTNYSAATAIGTTWTKVDSGSLTPPATTKFANITYSVAEANSTIFVDDMQFTDFVVTNVGTGYPTAQTSGLEAAGVGEWATSYTTSPLVTLAKSTTFAHTGTGSLLTTPNAAFLSVYARPSYPGYVLNAGNKTLSIWARPASGSTVLELRITWYDVAQAVISTVAYVAGTYAAGAWSKLNGGTAIVPPGGAVYGNVVCYTDSNVAVYWDDLVFADTAAPAQASAKVWVYQNNAFGGVGKSPAVLNVRKSGVWFPSNP